MFSQTEAGHGQYPTYLTWVVTGEAATAYQPA
jgi:hypothetical protein